MSWSYSASYSPRIGLHWLSVSGVLSVSETGSVSGSPDLPVIELIEIDVKLL